MKKVIYIMCMIFAFTMMGCQSKTSDTMLENQKTQEPKETEGPKETEESKKTEEPKETEEPMKTKEPQKEGKAYYGSFTITGYKQANISGMAEEDAQNAVGKTITYDKDSFKGIDSIVVEQPKYVENEETKETLEEVLQGLATCEELGVKTDMVTSVWIMNTDAIGQMLYVIGSDSIVIYQDGVLFTTSKQ